ncbi:cell division ATP-binding protein FtsE [bacterium (Candidatus Torokbacteria) CG09_land_8_20_14_0_10_42_11]|nr:MAG: cell division ATP-binding protein FtsE [bacterium (Candidatus Torokbacteria) CG09_land_8_20_14_0_10_42_11]
MIELKNVTKIYNQNSMALDHINLFIKKGEFVSVVGASGAGKSTLMKLLIAEEKPTEGEVTVDKWRVNDLKGRQLPRFRRNIGVVFQNYRLLPKKTAAENLAFAMEVSGSPRDEIAECVPQMLDIVGLKDKHDRFPVQLSGGEQQRIAIARALIHEPSLLIADEPTGNLDTFATWDIIKLLLKINELGTTVVLASHDREVVNAINKRVVTLEKGLIIRDQEQGKYMI